MKIAALLAGLAALLPQAAPEGHTHRITGLFSREREEDLKEAFKKVAGVVLLSVDFDRSEAVLSYDPSKLSNKKVEKEREKEILERLDNLLRSASTHTFGVKARCTTPADKLTRIEIGVAGLDCRGCGLAAYETVSKIDGVEQATASFKEGRVTALIDPAKTTRAALEEALTKRGVKVLGP